MILFLLAYFGGVLTIVSPCILPVLPFVFARGDRPFLSSGLPMLVGMGATFAAVATLAAVGGGWAVAANQYGRLAAVALLALFGIALLFPGLSERMTRPLVALGARLSATADQGAGAPARPFWPSLLLGVATGLLWAPCAGPVLGLILTGAALQGANVQTSLLLLAYAAGAATSLALALLVGERVFAAMKRSLGAGEWIRRGLGVAVLVAVAAIASGFDTGFLTRVSLASTASLEQGLLDKFHAAPAPAAPSVAMSNGPAMMSANPAMMMSATTAKAQPAAASLPTEGEMPPLSGAVAWLNSPPLTKEGLKGKVVLVDFWTYSCINCLRAIPYVRAWAEKYRDQGLVVIGVHAPEFAFEKNIDNVRHAVADLAITYPVAIDNDYAIWRAFDNQYWPAHYFIDAEGRIRHHHFGEGDYEESERVIQELLAEAGKTGLPGSLVAVARRRVRKPPRIWRMSDRRKPMSAMTGPPISSRPAARCRTRPMSMPRQRPGSTNGRSPATGRSAASMPRSTPRMDRIVYRFHARDLHLVLGPAPDGKPVRYRVTIDGKAPGDSHGADVDAEGNGVVSGQRLYQLVRQSGPITDRTFEIEFLDPGVQAYAFTFG